MNIILLSTGIFNPSKKGNYWLTKMENPFTANGIPIFSCRCTKVKGMMVFCGGRVLNFSDSYKLLKSDSRANFNLIVVQTESIVSNFIIRLNIMKIAL